MIPYEIILKKRNGEELSKEEIDFMVQGFTKGEIPDYQMAAFLMAVFFRGMSFRETKDLTLSMMNSGKVLDLSAVGKMTVDKHSTGGVGDKVSLILAPLVASAGVVVPMMSGRGLGHTGGTLDKLESISGFNVNLSEEQFIEQLKKIGVAIIGQTKDIAPADKKIYALRDVTATVDSIPLITASIMSKKFAEGTDAIVMDVKWGSGAFMQTLESAEELARTIVGVGKEAGKKVVAYITDMNEPLGKMVGNAVEVKESIEALKGNGEGRLMEVVMTLASEMLVIGGVAKDRNSAFEVLKGKISDGSALDKFRQMVEMQGGNPEVVDNPDVLPKAKKVIDVKSDRGGFITAVNTVDVGISALLLGAGRTKADDVIDHAVGIEILKRIGDKVDKGEVMARFFVNDDRNLDEAVKRFLNAYEIGDARPEERKVVVERFD